MKNILFCIFLCTGSLAQAKTILFKAPRLSHEQFAVFLRLHPRFVSFSEWQRSQTPEPLASHQLEVAYLRAKKAYISKDASQVRAAYKQLAALAFEQDWRPFQQKILVKSFWRLAQFSAQGAEDDLQQALCFAPDQVPEPKNFPPPFQSQWRQIRARQKWNHVELAPWFQGFSAVVVNGHPYTYENNYADSMAFCENRTYRLHFISDSYQGVTVVLSGSELKNYHPPRVSLVHGNCQKPELASSAPGARAIYYQNDCLASIEGSTKLPNSSLLPNRPHGKSPFTLSTASLLPKPKDLGVTRHHSWWRKNWMWLTLGAVAGGYAIYRSEQPHVTDRARPVHRDGFQ